MAAKLQSLSTLWRESFLMAAPSRPSGKGRLSVQALFLAAIIECANCGRFEAIKLVHGRSHASIFVVRPEVTVPVGFLTGEEHRQAVLAAYESITDSLQLPHASWHLDLVVFPELVLGGNSSLEMDYLPAMSDWANKLHSFMVFPFEEFSQERDANGARQRFNSAAIFDRSGTRIATYRKQRLTGNEKQLGFSEGEQLTPVDADFGRFAVLLCQDIYYPVLWEAAHAAHVDMLIWPSAFEGNGFLSAYARLFSMAIVPATPYPLKIRPFDMTGSTFPLTDSMGLMQQSDLKEGLATLIWIHNNSRVVCAANSQLNSFTERLQKAGTLRILRLNNLLWSGCFLIQGVPHRPERVVERNGSLVRIGGKPSFVVDNILAWADRARGLLGPLAEGRYGGEMLSMGFQAQLNMQLSPQVERD